MQLIYSDAACASARCMYIFNHVTLATRHQLKNINCNLGPKILNYLIKRFIMPSSYSILLDLALLQKKHADGEGRLHFQRIVRWIWNLPIILLYRVSFIIFPDEILLLSFILVVNRKLWSFYNLGVCCSICISLKLTFIFPTITSWK